MESIMKRLAGFSVIAILHCASLAVAHASENTSNTADESLLGNYHPYEPVVIEDWRESNARTNAKGGWRAYAREAADENEDVERMDEDSAHHEHDHHAHDEQPE